MLDAAAIGPLLPDAYAVVWSLGLLLPVVLAALGFLALYFVIKRGVVAGVRRARSEATPSTEVRQD